MAINYTTLFARLGKGWYSVDLVNEFSGAAGSGAIATDLPTEWEDFVEQYDAANATIRGIVSDGEAQLIAAQEALASYKTWAAGALGDTVLEMADADNPLTERTLYAAVAELIRQMGVDSKKVNANTPGASVTYGSGNVGNGAVAVCLYDGRGVGLQYCYDEDLSGSFTSASTARSEVASISGETAAASLLDYHWPLGSGLLRYGLTSFDAALDTNLLPNGDFEDWTAGVPDHWTAGSIAGTQETSVVYRTGSSLKINSNGGTGVVYQQTLTGLESKTNYALNLFAKISATGTGIVTIDLYDGASVISDENGNQQTWAINVASLTTSFAAFNTAFRLPEPVPATVTLRVRVTTSVAVGKFIYVDDMALVEMSQPYPGGPFVAVFSGSVNWCLDDTFNVAVTNDYGGKLQTALWRALDLPSLGLVIPCDFSGTENILDSVIS